jgi:hypothetical protein
MLLLLMYGDTLGQLTAWLTSHAYRAHSLAAVLDRIVSSPLRQGYKYSMQRDDKEGHV